MKSINLDEHALPVKISRKISPYLAGPWFTLALAAMMLVTYILDLNTPLGVPIWLLYFIPLIFSFWSKPYFAVPTVCVVTLLFLAAGFIFSPSGIQTSAALFMRTVFSVVYISTSVVFWMIRRRKKRVFL
ncbi:MAG TPA: hypothetical protein VMW77_08680 [Methanoregula sp.]|nr:hypothetical protein [Methanoregula sp.]